VRWQRPRIHWISADACKLPLPDKSFDVVTCSLFLHHFDEPQAISVLCEAGPARFAVPATSVLEVANPDPSAATLRGHHPLVDLSRLLGGPAEPGPGTAVLLDTSPTLALRVKKVRGVRDTASCPWLHLPRRLAPSLEPAVRGVLDIDGELFLELNVEALALGVRPPPELKVVDPFGPALPAALVFETGARLVGLPLSAVVQVVSVGPHYCTLPAATAAAGVLIHRQQVWPVFSLPALLGEPALREDLVVLAEVADDGVGLLASRALGVREGAALAGVASLELRRMFS
jgi:chemotaxis signal transduction protein